MACLPGRDFIDFPHNNDRKNNDFNKLLTLRSALVGAPYNRGIEYCCHLPFAASTLPQLPQSYK
jgi:hypothetical protein